jgi:nitrogen fixation NifU-like protein
MSQLEDLYQEIILENSRRPENFGVLKDRTHHADGRNPLCGDEIAVSLRVDGGQIEEIRFQGQACAIAKASASIMTRWLAGRPVEEAKARAERFLGVMRSDVGDEEITKNPELAALTGVKRFPARVKCAALAWRALLAAMEEQASATSEDTEGSS